MSGQIAVGTLLVLATWAAAAAAVVAVGLVPALAMTSGRWTSSTLRVAVWSGLVALAIVTVGLSIVMPLRSGAAAFVVLAFIALIGALGIGWSVRARRRSPARSQPIKGWRLAVLAALAVAQAFLAAAALGRVTNYDSGLYHLGAIHYAGDYAAIPGLANLYFPLGYANAEFPLAALLGNGPWDGIGYRLLNGLLFGLVALDLVARLRRPRLTVGAYILMVGVTAAWLPMVALADYWVTSPSSDSAVLVLSITAAAYVADAVAGGHRWAVQAAVSVLLASLMVMLRPTMAIYAILTVVVVTALAVRRRGTARQEGLTAAVMVSAGMAALAALAISARDYVLSGWLQFPLSVVSFDVPWRALDPVDARAATLGAARDPAELWSAAQGWGWVPGWIGRLPGNWEVYAFGVLAVAAAVLVVLAHRRAPGGIRARGLALAMLPSVIAVTFWWLFTPPSFRFIWGPLFCTAAVPIGWSLWQLARADRKPGTSPWPRLAGWTLAYAILAVTAFTAVARFDAAAITQERVWRLGVSIPYAVAPVPGAADVPVSTATTPTGLVLLQPIPSDQCWDVFPLCTPQVFSDIRQRGPSIQDGFAP